MPSYEEYYNSPSSSLNPLNVAMNNNAGKIVGVNPYDGMPDNSSTKNSPPEAGVVDQTGQNTGTPPTDPPTDPYDPSGEGEGGQGGGSDAGDKGDESGGGSGGSGGGQGSGGQGGGQGGGQDPSGNLNKLTNLNTILSGYDVDQLEKEFGDIFEDYDPTQEDFVRAALGLDQDALGLAKQEAGIGFDRQTGQLTRQQDLLEGQQGYLAQALDRDQRSLGLQVGLAEDQLGFAGRARDQALSRTDLQRQLLEGEVGEDGRLAQEFAAQQRRFDLRQGAMTEQRDESQAAILDQMAGIDRQRDVLDIGEEGQLSQLDARKADIKRELQNQGLSEDEAERQASFQIGEQSRQATTQLGDIRRQQQGLDLGRMDLQDQIAGTVDEARGNLLDLYSQGRQATGGFAGSGARVTATERARDRYTGDVGRRTGSLRRAESRLDIQQEGLESRASDIRAGLTARTGEIEAGLQTFMDRGDITREGAEARVGELASNYQRQLDLGDVQRRGFDTQQGALGRKQDLVTNLFNRQMNNLGLDKTVAQSSYDRKMGQLGAQLGGLDIADDSAKLQYDQQSGRLNSQLGQYGIQGEGLQAQYDQRSDQIQSQLAGIGAELGEDGFLNLAYQNRLQNLDLGMDRRELQAQRDIYGIQSDYADEQRGTLIDLIRSEADLGRFKIGDTVGTDNAYNDADQGSKDAFDSWAGSDQAQALRQHMTQGQLYDYWQQYFG